MSETFVYDCADEASTVRLATRLAEISRVGDVWALYGTLGMGKSVFARAFIKHLSGASEVPSPTFTLVQTYETPQFEIYHYDLYRLRSPEEIWELNMEEALYSAVCLIEWPEKMGAYLPADVFCLKILPQEGNVRRIEITTKSPEKEKRLAAVDIRTESRHD